MIYFWVVAKFLQLLNDFLVLTWQIILYSYGIIHIHQTGKRLSAQQINQQDTAILFKCLLHLFLYVQNPWVKCCFPIIITLWILLVGAKGC